MGNALRATRTHTEELAREELRLEPTPEVTRPIPLREPRTADRIKEALLRWLEEEM